jgi:hypothetical protein
MEEKDSADSARIGASPQIGPRPSQRACVEIVSGQRKRRGVSRIMASDGVVIESRQRIVSASQVGRPRVHRRMLQGGVLSPAIAVAAHEGRRRLGVTIIQAGIVVGLLDGVGVFSLHLERLIGGLMLELGLLGRPVDRVEEVLLNFRRR